MTPSPHLSEVSFVAVDVETTGLDPRSDSILEIGAVIVRDGKMIEEFDTLVAVDRAIPRGAARVNGITKAMLIGKPHIREAMDDFLSFAGDGVLVEHSQEAFDVAFLEHAHGRPLAVPYINTCTLSRKLFPFMPKHSLSECCRRHNIVNDTPHRALGDARATAGLLICLLETCATRYPHLDDLIRVASIDHGPARKSSARRRPRGRRQAPSALS